jgi:hypothetical protein
VRTITVPAMAVLVGKANWWPSESSGAKHRKARRHADRADERHAADEDATAEPFDELQAFEADCPNAAPLEDDDRLPQEDWIPVEASASSNRVN